MRHITSVGARSLGICAGLISTLSGCNPILRSARIDPGASVAVTAGFPVGAADVYDESGRLPRGQLDVRYGLPATDTSWGFSAGVAVPWYLAGTTLDLYVERPRRRSSAMGIGFQLGWTPAVYHLVSFPLDSLGRAELTLGNRLLTSLSGSRDGVFVAWDVTLGLQIALGQHFTAQLGYSHYFVPGSFTFNPGEDPFRVLGDIDLLLLGVSWRRGGARPFGR